MAHRWALRCGSLHLGQGACVYLCTVVNLSLWTQESVLGAPLGPVDRICVLLCVWVSLAGGHRSYGSPADPCPLVLQDLAQEPAFLGSLALFLEKEGLPPSCPFISCPQSFPPCSWMCACLLTLLDWKPGWSHYFPISNTCQCLAYSGCSIQACCLHHCPQTVSTPYTPADQTTVPRFH